MNELMTINKLQTAKLAVREVKELDEIKRIADQAEALKGYAKAQKLSEDIQADVAEYALYAFRQLGVISKGLDKAKVKPLNDEFRNTEVVGVPKKEVLADVAFPCNVLTKRINWPPSRRKNSPKSSWRKGSRATSREKAWSKLPSVKARRQSAPRRSTA